MTQNGDTVAAGDSFWDVSGYQHVVKRTECGVQMCGELSKLVLERSEIEKDYAKRLKCWAHKWRDNFDHGLVAALLHWFIWIKISIIENFYIGTECNQPTTMTLLPYRYCIWRTNWVILEVEWLCYWKVKIVWWYTELLRFTVQCTWVTDRQMHRIALIYNICAVVCTAIVLHQFLPWNCM